MRIRKGSLRMIYACMLALFAWILCTAFKSKAGILPEKIHQAVNSGNDTTRKDKISSFAELSTLRNSGKLPFYGVWADYFSSYLKINADSTFKFTWGYDFRGSWTTGKWKRVEDTFYFRVIPVFDTLRITENNIIRVSMTISQFPVGRLISKKNDSEEIPLFVQNAVVIPDKLCYYKNKLYLLDSNGMLMKDKIISPYMGQRKFKTFYFREKRFNLSYFDSNYYHKSSKRPFRMGIGINVMLQPVTGYRVVGSFGFTLSPRYIFKRKDDSYLSLGIPLTTGFSRFDDTLSIDLKLGTMIDLPLILNYNYDPGSVENGGSRFGYFAGGGVAYHYNHYTAAKDHATITQRISGFGPAVNAGIRVSMQKYRLRSLEFKLSYMRMIIKSETDVFGAGLIINF